MHPPPRILYCHCSRAEIIPPGVKQLVLERLSGSDLSFDLVPDLCELASCRDPILSGLTTGGPVKIAACHPRAVKWLMATASVPGQSGAVQVVNMRELTGEQVADKLLAPAEDPSLAAGSSAPKTAVMGAARSIRARAILYEGPGSTPLEASRRHSLLKALLEAGFAVTRLTTREQFLAQRSDAVVVLAQRNADLDLAKGVAPDDASGHVLDIAGLTDVHVLARMDAARQAVAGGSGGWMPWFPVIDYDRCTHCMQCLSFCLFDVFGVTEDRKIEVRHRENCKTSCPACSRVCPEMAIIFPKHHAAPINGAEVSSSDLERETMKVDISALLGGDTHSLLRQRSDRARARFSSERDPDTALQERRKCLARLVQSGDIPPEVLLSLPTPEEIQRRANEAAARAREARDNAGLG